MHALRLRSPRTRLAAEVLDEEPWHLETDTIIHTALFSGILGFVVFCASYAFHVWRTRNAASRKARSLGARLLQWSVLSVCLGCILLVVSLIWREVKPREGVLSGEGLYTVRASEDLQLERVTGARAVHAGDVLAVFRSPQRRADLAELELKREILETQKKVTELQPLTLDGELVRDHERAVADQRQLLASLTYLVPEHAVIVREKLRDRLDKTERVNALTTRIEEARRELTKAQARRELAVKHCTRVENLSEKGAAAELERDERITERMVQQTEVERLQASITNMELERDHLQESLPAFAACTSQQAGDLERELARVRGHLATAEQQVSADRERLNRDRQRAELLRTQMLAQLEIELRQCQAKQEGIQDVLTVRAPFDGTIAYADHAPATALPRAPVVILAPEQGFRLRLRLTDSEIEHLSRAGPVTLGLLAPVLQRRFSGRLVSWEQLPDEPGYVLAELTCLPPPETIRELAARDWGAHDWMQVPTIQVRLLWRPPILASPVFYPAVGMIGIGLVGLCAMVLSLRRVADPAVSAQASKHPVAASEQLADLPSELISPLPTTSLALGSAELESGALGRNLQMLGNRLRESIKRQTLEPKLIGAVEWAIDRHHLRAIEHLSVGLDHDPDVAASLHELIVSNHGDGRGDSTGDALGASGRLLRIVRTIAPHLLNHAQADACKAMSSNGRGSSGGVSQPCEPGAASR